MQCSNKATDSVREKLLSECDSNNKSLLNGSLLQSLNWLSWAEVIMEKNLHPECLDFVSMTDRVLQSYQQRIQRMKRTESLFFAACILSLGGVTGTNSLIRHHNTTHAPGRSLESDQSNVKQVEWSLGLGRICSWIVVCELGLELYAEGPHVRVPTHRVEASDTYCLVVIAD